MSETIYTTGGTVSADNPLYINRRADDELLGLSRASEYAYILTARQLGKSSLILRTAIRLRETGIQAAIVDLQRIGKQAVSAPQWFLGLLREISRGLALDADLLAWWREREHLGMAQRLTLFFEELVLERIAAPIVVFIDEIDTTIGLDFADDFFVALRALYESRTQNSSLKRLSFVLIGTAAPGDLISDPKRTPFNIGRRVDLTDFSFDEALPFADGLGLPAKQARQVLEWVLHWTHGHPYLTQRLCRALATAKATSWNRGRVDAIVASTFFGEKSRQDSNLEFVRNMLLRAPEPPGAGEVLTTYLAIRKSRPVVRDEEQSLVKSHLKLSGVVRRERDALRVRHPIYQHVFDERWIREHLPTTWPERLRRARRIAFAIIVPLFIVAVALAVYASQLAVRARSDQRAAELSRQTAVAAYATAEAGQAEANREKERANANELEAQIAAANANAARATAEALGTTAATRALALAVQTAPDPEMGLMIAIEGAQRSPANPAVVSILRQAIRTSNLRSMLRGHTGELTGAAFSPDGKRVATGSTDTTARIWAWNGIVASPVITLTGHMKGITSVAFSPDGQYVATASQDTSARVWDALTGGQALQQLHGNGEPVYSVAFSADGKLLLTASRDSVARVWDWRAGALLAELRGHTDLINSAVFGPDGRSIVTASRDKTALIWSWDGAARAPEPSLKLSGHAAGVYSAIFSHDGSYVVTASQDGTARVWDARTGAQLALLRENQTSPALYSAAFSSDASYVAVASVDGTAQIWDWRTQQLAGSLIGHTARIWGAAFSADGRNIVTASADGTARVWDAGSSAGAAELPGSMNELIALARSRVTRALTPEEIQQYLPLEATLASAERRPAGTPTH